MGRYLNLWRSTHKVPEKVHAVVVNISGEKIDKDTTEHWKTVKSFMAAVSNRGLDVANCPQSLQRQIGGDVLVLSGQPIYHSELSERLPKFENIESKLVNSVQLHFSEYPWVYDSAWKTAVRTHARRVGYFTLGSSYVPIEKVAIGNYVESIRVTAEINEGYPSLWLDPGTKVMIPFSPQEARTASEQGVPARVLMEWKSAFVVGTYPENVGRFKPFDLKSIWGARGVALRNEDSVYKVKFRADQSEPYAYPQGAVFKEYNRMETNLPKYAPTQKIQIAQTFLKGKMGAIKFLGNSYFFGLSPTSVEIVTQSQSQFESGRDFIVKLRKYDKSYPVNVFGIKSALSGGAEPYTGKKSGRYYVVCPLSCKDSITTAIGKIQSEYRNLSMGSISPAAEIRFVEGTSQSEYIEAFNLAIEEIIREAKPEMPLVFVVLPDVEWENALYYTAKNTFFNPSAVLENVRPIQIQCLEEATLTKIPQSDAITSNIVPQIYLKLFGKHAAVWVCDKPADAHVYPNNPGITAYACFDVSRRKKLKSQVSVFTAVTDGYGRFIAYANIPSGGENLSQILFAKLLESIAKICKQYSDVFSSKEPQLKFNLQRIVLYKDGQVDRNESRMMQDVFEHGIPEEGIKPLSEHFAGRRDLPSSLAVDIVGVNKSSIKRIFDKDKADNWANPPRGVCLVEKGSKSCLLVGSESQKRSGVDIHALQPLQIEHIHHFLISSSLPSPAVQDLAREYYHLSFLDWVSFYQRSKFALPQRITQKTGEYLSYQVRVPQGITLI